MTGTLVNAGAIAIGTLIGMLFRSRISERYTKAIFVAIGMFTIVLGISMALKTEHYFWMVLSLIVGTLLGTWWKINERIEMLSARFNKSSGQVSTKDAKEGAIVAFLLFCMGSLTILGAIEEGIGDTPTVLYTKSLMDGISSIALGAAFGYSVLFSIPLLLVYQGGLTLLTRFFHTQIPEIVINELIAVGGVILLALGISILEIKQVKVADMLPALLVIVLLSMFLP